MLLPSIGAKCALQWIARIVPGTQGKYFCPLEQEQLTRVSTSNAASFNLPSSLQLYRAEVCFLKQLVTQAPPAEISSAQLLKVQESCPFLLLAILVLFSLSLEMPEIELRTFPIKAYALLSWYGSVQTCPSERWEGVKLKAWVLTLYYQVAWGTRFLLLSAAIYVLEHLLCCQGAWEILLTMHSSSIHWDNQGLGTPFSMRPSGNNSTGA